MIRLNLALNTVCLLIIRNNIIVFVDIAIMFVPFHVDTFVFVMIDHNITPSSQRSKNTHFCTIIYIMCAYYTEHGYYYLQITRYLLLSSLSPSTHCAASEYVVAGERNIIIIYISTRNSPARQQGI